MLKGEEERGRRLKKFLVGVTGCLLILGSSLTAFAAGSTEKSLRSEQFAYDVDPNPICEMEVVPYAKVVTASDVWYGAQLFAEGRLLCIESFVTVMDGNTPAYHYTRASIEHKTYGSVLREKTEWGTGEVHSNIYDIPQSADPDGRYKGRVYYGW